MTSRLFLTFTLLSCALVACTPPPEPASASAAAAEAEGPPPSSVAPSAPPAASPDAAPASDSDDRPTAGDACVALAYEEKPHDPPSEDFCMRHLGLTTECVRDFWQRVRRVFADPDLGGLDEVFQRQTRINVDKQKRRTVTHEELRSEFEELFPPAFVGRVVRSGPRVDCLGEGSMIALGLLWARPDPEDRRLRIAVINAMDPTSERANRW